MQGFLPLIKDCFFCGPEGTVLPKKPTRIYTEGFSYLFLTTLLPVLWYQGQSWNSWSTKSNNDKAQNT